MVLNSSQTILDQALSSKHHHGKLKALSQQIYSECVEVEWICLYDSISFTILLVPRQNVSQTRKFCYHEIPPARHLLSGRDDGSQALLISGWSLE